MACAQEAREHERPAGSNRRWRWRSGGLSSDLQISLLAEHEVTRSIQVTEAIGKQLRIQDFSPSDVFELKQDVAPDEVLDQIEKLEREAG